MRHFIQANEKVRFIICLMYLTLNKKIFGKLFNVLLTYQKKYGKINSQKRKEGIKMEPTWFEIIGFGIFVIGTWWALFKAVAAVADAEERRRENSDWKEL